MPKIEYFGSLGEEEFYSISLHQILEERNKLCFPKSLKFRIFCYHHIV